MKIYFLNIFLVINKRKLVLYFLLTTMMSGLSKYLNEQWCIFKCEATKMKLAKNKKKFFKQKLFCIM